MLSPTYPILKMDFRGTRVAQWVKRLTLDLDSGHDLMVHEVKPHIGLCADTTKPAWDSLSLPSPSLSLSLSLKINTLKKKFRPIESKSLGTGSRLQSLLKSSPAAANV